MTVLADLSFEPEKFFGYVQIDLRKRSRFFQSGVVQPSPVVLPTMGHQIVVPAWNGLQGSAEILSDTTPLTGKKLQSSKQVATILDRGDYWDYNDLVSLVSDSDPFGDIARKLATYWAREYDATLVSSVVGAAGGIDDAGSVVNDDSTNSISAANVIATRALFGEDAGESYFMVAHPTVVASLEAQDLTTTIPDSQGRPIQSYQNMPLLRSNTTGMDAGAGVFNTLIVRPNSVLFADARNAERFFEPNRDVKAGNNGFASRNRFVIHPVGSQFTGTPAGQSADNVELATAGNWALGGQDERDFGVRMLKSLA